MLPFPSEWVQHFGSNLVTAYPPGGGGRFRYHERLRPQPSFSAIVSRMLASDPDFTVHHVGELLRLVTAEGEYGAWVKIDGLREGSRAVRYLRRWNESTTDLALSVDEYRAAVVNHEVGHTLGKDHVGCDGSGLRAPVMMQQSKGLAGCLANPWPALDGT